ncbi:MAG: hypothetical protein COX51_05815 [Syntrophobacteraceae bacterium CG23_combo_of_CG06-09_8_20_14_all_50_8]|nr:MAG: hypothetical protein COX51_05815 [Syntrophobacteraceae bacterium CG23_combo_of_CG06-09_8_20_14_all_50_8]
MDVSIKSPKFPPPRRGRVRERVISDRISICYFPLPLIPSRKGMENVTFYEPVKFQRSQT